MCPACYASLALVVTGATSAGGVTAFVAAKVYKSRRHAKLVLAASKGEHKEDSDRRSS
jgi:hypothetical protein